MHPTKYLHGYCSQHGRECKITQQNHLKDDHWDTQVGKLRMRDVSEKIENTKA